jgi:hypothetical protein
MYHTVYMDVYHEIDTESLQSVLLQGLKRTSRGAKGEDKIVRSRRPYLEINDEHLMTYEHATHE